MRHNGLARALIVATGLSAFCLPAGAQDHSGMHGPMVPAAANERAFPLPDAEARERFARGRNVMHRVWVAALAEDTLHDGLGPLYTRDSCNACHPDNERGGGSVNARPDERTSIVRLSVRNGARLLDHPVYGAQLDELAIPGVPAEGHARFTYRQHEVTLRGGLTVELREPRIELTALQYGSIGRSTMISVRAAPAVLGLGLLERVPESALWALSDPDDADRDGISGRPNLIPDPTTGQQRIGRFGWKATAPSLASQVASAFHDDMGLSTRLRTEPTCTPRQTACREAPPAGSPEVSDFMFDNLVLYLTHLQPAEPRAPAAAAGETIFHETGCGACHRPTLNTDADARNPALSLRQFAPFTDLLLHDMGPALADNRPDQSATGSEWRTAPLWGLSRALRDSHAGLLHDGRARTITEAILWHGGEANAARERFRNLDEAARMSLLAFLGSL